MLPKQVNRLVSARFAAIEQLANITEPIVATVVKDSFAGPYGRISIIPADLAEVV